MERDIRIYFKVDGIEQYITSLDELQGALKGVEGATEQATQATKELTNAQDDIEALEGKLDALEGGVKVLAGSFEAAAGALSLLGVDDGFLGKLEENVFGVLALGRGVIDLTEGYRLLKQNTILATYAQRALNIAQNANPWMLLASAVIAAGAALLTWKMNAEESSNLITELTLEVEAMSSEDLRKEIDKTTASVNSLREAVYGKTKTDLDRANELISEITKNLEDTAKKQTSIYDDYINEISYYPMQQRRKQAIDDLLKADEEYLYKNIDFLEQKLEKEGLTQEEEIRLREYNIALSIRQEGEKQTALTTELENAEELRKEILRKKREDERDAAKAFADGLLQLEKEYNQARIDDNERVVDENIRQFERETKRMKEELDKRRTDQQNWNDWYDQQIQNRIDADQRDEDNKKRLDELILQRDQLIQESKWALAEASVNAGRFAADMVLKFGKDEEKAAKAAFIINKLASISDIIINYQKGKIAAFASAQVLPPGFKEGYLAKQLAGLRINSAIAIASVLATKFGGGGNIPPDTDTGGFNPGAAINYNFGQNAGQEIQPGQLSSGQQPEPLRAYVLVSDVNNAQQANNQIQNLARL